MMMCSIDDHCPLCDESCQYYQEVKPYEYGEIIETTICGLAERHCSNCGHSLTAITKVSEIKFCPYCGAELS